MELEDDILFAGLGLRSEEVLSGGRLAFMLSLVLLPALVLAQAHPIVLVLVVTLAFILSRTVVSFPRGLAVAMQKSSFREAPEVMSHMIGGAGEALSHENAVLAVSRNSRGEVKVGFERLLWLVYLKGRSLPEEFVSYARKWKDRNRGFGEAMLSLSGAVEESSGDDLGFLLSAIHAHTRRKLRRFLFSLKAPISVVFALGIVLPVMIASFLPMSSLALASPIGLADENIEGRQANGLHPGLVAVILDVAFPLFMLLYCREVLSGRPIPSRTARPLELSDVLPPVLALLATISLLVAVVVIWHIETPYAFLAILAFSSLLISFSMLWAGRSRHGGDSSKLAREFPEAAEHLGRFLLAGEPPETALLKTGRKMEGTELSGKFAQALYHLSRGKSDVGTALVDSLAPTGTGVTSNLRMIFSIAEKDPALAGRIAKHISSNLKEVSRIEENARDEIRPTIQTLRNTTTFFSPLVLGVTASMSLLMERFSQSSNLSSFILILGGLLFCNSAVASYLVEGLQGGDRPELMRAIGRAIPMATLIFSLSFLASSFLFGVL